MSKFEIINEVPQWTNDGIGSVDIIHESDANKDLQITQANYTLSADEITKIYAYCQAHPEVEYVVASRGKDGAVIEVTQGKETLKIKMEDLPKADVPELSAILTKEPVSELSWVASLKRAARDGKYVRIDSPISPKNRAKYADLFKKNFENWAKQSRTDKMTLGRYDYNSICYVGPSEQLEQNRYGMEGNGYYNPLLKGQMVAKGSAESDFAERLTEVLKEGNLEYVELGNRFECNGVMICTFDYDEMSKMQSALPNSFSQKEMSKYDEGFCFLNFKDFDFGKTDEEKFEAFGTAWSYNRSDVAAQIIKENPELLESEPMKKFLSPYDKMNAHTSTGEWRFEKALEMVEKLKYLRNKGVITSEQFNKTVNTQSPDIGETLLTHAVKLAVKEAGESPYYGKNYLEIIDRALSAGLDCNVPNARGQYPLELIKEVDIEAHRVGLARVKNSLSIMELDNKPTFAKIAQEMDKLTNPVTKVRINKLEPHVQADIVDDKNAPKIKGDVSRYNFGANMSKELYSEADVWTVKVERPSYLASDIQNPADIAWILPKGEYVVAQKPYDHISSIEEFKKGKKTLYVSDKDGAGKIVPAEKVVSTILATQKDKGNSIEL